VLLRDDRCGAGAAMTRAAPSPQSKQPPSRYRLGLLPTPVHRFSPPGVPAGVELWVKRDDLSGMQLSGNKVRGSKRAATAGDVIIEH
jgi:hypothetical protein